ATSSPRRAPTWSPSIRPPAPPAAPWTRSPPAGRPGAAPPAGRFGLPRHAPRRGRRPHTPRNRNGRAVMLLDRSALRLLMLAAGVAGADACGPEGAEIRGADAAKADAPLVDAPARLAADTDTTRRAGPPAPGAQGRASAAEYEGWRQYAVNCARCHGDDAVGGVMAPDLRASVARGS